MFNKCFREDIKWRWRKFIPYRCHLFSRHDVGQALRNVC